MRAAHPEQEGKLRTPIQRASSEDTHIDRAQGHVGQVRSVGPASHQPSPIELDQADLRLDPETDRLLPDETKPKKPRQHSPLLNGAITVIGLLVFWQIVVFVFQTPSYMLPSPIAVSIKLVTQANFLAYHAWITLIEIIIGLFVGMLAGCLLALSMSESALAERTMKPMIVISQAFPVFALAPILVLWFGYGMGSKIVMSALIIFFPVASSFYDGLKNTDPDLLDLGRVYGATRLQLTQLIKIPAAAPALASGTRMAATVAPIGAVIGEWVGASQGLGFVMLRASARVQIDTMFAALVILAAMALALRFGVDYAARRIVHWMPQSTTL